MATLVFGVVEMAYTNNQGQPQLTTTGKVAEILEKNYSVMGIFYELKKAQIGGDLRDAMAKTLQDLFAGRKTKPTYDASQKIETDFRNFIFNDEINKLVRLDTGVSISGAAARGVNHRKKQPYAKRAARPAFVDTGLYVSSFRAEMKHK